MDDIPLNALPSMREIVGTCKAWCVVMWSMHMCFVVGVVCGNVGHAHVFCGGRGVLRHYSRFLFIGGSTGSDHKHRSNEK